MGYFRKEAFTLARFYMLGWVIFCLVEITFRFIKYATFPWYRGTLIAPFYLLLLLIYGMLGMGGGLLIGSVLRTLSKGSVRGRWRIHYFYLSSCQTVLAALYIGDFLHQRNLLHNAFYLLVYSIVCAAVFMLLYLFFTVRGKRGTLTSAFILSSLVIDILLIGGFYIHRNFIESQQTGLSFSLMTNIGVLLGACFLVCLFFAAVLWVIRKLASPLFINKKVLCLFGSALIGAVILFWLFSSSSTTRLITSEKNRNRPHVILITMDTTRSDHVSCYGYDKKTTPFLDQLAADGVVFENVHSTSSWTLPAHASLFTGLYPFSHNAYVKEGSWGFKVLEDKIVTLAEVLAHQGYKTAGFIGGYFCSSFFGIAQGFDYYYENLFNLIIEFDYFFVTRIYRSFFPFDDFFEKNGLAGKKITPQINRAALKWIAKNSHTPFFLFLNYFDPHHPYISLDSDEIASPRQLSINHRNYVGWELGVVRQVLRKVKELGSKEKKYLLDRYDHEIKQMDRGIGELVQFLKEKGLYDNALIIVTSDHGESFGEHGLMIHSPAVYEELVKVPLIVKYPKDYQKTPQAFTPLSLVDVMPEILTVVDIPIPQEVQGVPFSRGKRTVLVERYKDKSWTWTAFPFGERSLRAVYKGDYKYIWATDGKHELYNLKDDPRELHNLVEAMPLVAREMETMLSQWSQRTGQENIKDKPSKMEKGVEEALKALGYLQ